MALTDRHGGNEAAVADLVGPVVLVLDHVNAYYTQLLEGVRSILIPAQIPLVVYANDPFASSIRPALKRLFKLRQVRGVIATLLTDASSQADLTRTLEDSLLPCVQVGTRADNGWSVGVDNGAAMRALMAHVLDEVGAKRIAIMRGVNHHPDAQERERCVRAELLARGLELDPGLVLEGQFDRDVAYKSMARALKSGARPEAVVAFNDRSALGVIDAIVDAGLQVPADMAVTGFDDEMLAREYSPSVTTVRQELFAQGERAARLLLQRIAGEPPTGHVAYPGTAIVRESTRGSAAVRPENQPAELQPSQALAVAAMDRALSINRAFMACRKMQELLDELGASLLRLGLSRCFLVLNEFNEESAGARGILALCHVDGRTHIDPAAASFPLDEVLPRNVQGELNDGCLMLQPLSVDGRDLGYTLFDQVMGDRFVGELLRVDLSRAIDTLQQTERHASSLELLVARRTEQLEDEAAIRCRTERELRRVNQELLMLTKLDGLTGISNRAAFDRYLPEQWSAHIATGQLLSLLLLDVDRFKEHNDVYGHVSGDECLRVIARCLRESVWSPDDLAARYGGDEFVALLPRTDAAGAAAVAERVHRSLRALPWGQQAQMARQFTVSIGAATVLPTTFSGPADLIRMADTALYQAKLGGRDRLASAETSSSTPSGSGVPADGIA